jgi:hypothetical protein
MTRYNLNDRPYPGGSMEPRLNPKISDDRLNVKLGPRLPTPLVRETSTGAVDVGNNVGRRRLIGLPPRLENKD